MKNIVPVRRRRVEGVVGGEMWGGSSFARSRSMRKPFGEEGGCDLSIMMLFGDMSLWRIPPDSTRDLWPSLEVSIEYGSSGVYPLLISTSYCVSQGLQQLSHRSKLLNSLTDRAGDNN